MIREVDNTIQNKNSELLENIYLPAKTNSDIKNSKPFKILKENKQDVSELFTGEKNEMYEPIEIKKYEEKNKKSLSETYLEPIKELGNNLFDFVDQSFAGDIYNLTASGMKMSTTLNPDKIKEEMENTQIPPLFPILANNIGEFSVNMLPVMDKLIDFMAKSPSSDGKGIVVPDVFNNDEKLMEWSGEKVKYFKENRAKWKAIQEDKNMASQFADLVVQDSLVSLPIYTALTKAGVPKGWSTVFAFGVGSAIAIEEKVFGVESTFIQEYGKTEVEAVKNMLGILPNTPYDAIADEVIQTFEYTAFAFAIPHIIKAAQLMKKSLPSFAVGGAVAQAIEGEDPNNETAPINSEPKTLDFNESEKKKLEMNLDDQSAVPGTVNEYGFEKTSSIKALVNAVIPKKNPVFNSALKKAVENIAEKGSGEQMLGTIKNLPSVKANEIKWIGLDTFLEGKQSVTKKEIVDFVNQNSIEVDTVQFGGSRSDKALKLSDELEFKKNEFESKWLKSQNAKDYEADMLLDNNLRYDVYDFNKISNNGLTDTAKSIDFQRVDEILDKSADGFKTINTVFKNDGYLKNGKYSFVEVYDVKFHKFLMVTEDLAKKLETEKYRSAFFGKQDTLRYSKQRTYEFDELEIEKYLIEKEKREFFGANNKGGKFADDQTNMVGGKDYTELVLKFTKDIPAEVTIGNKYKNLEKYKGDPNASAGVKKLYFKNPSHMDVRGELAHVRFKTRIVDGKKILTVEEMQNDLIQRFKRVGKEAPVATVSNSGDVQNMDGRLLKDFALKNTWHEVVIKRLIRHATDNGFDAIAIPEAKLINARYDQSFSKAVTIEIDELATGYKINWITKEGIYAKSMRYEKNLSKDGYLSVNDHSFEGMEKDLGPELYKKITSGGITFKDKYSLPLPKETIIGDGAGKYRLYEEMIPKFLKKYSKKWNADIKVMDIEGRRITPGKGGSMASGKTQKQKYTILYINEAMKKSVKEEGQSLFEILAIGAGAGVAADNVSDSMKNNTISN